MTDPITAAIKEKYKDYKICVATPSSGVLDYRFTNDWMQFSTQNSNYMHMGVACRVSSRVAMNRNLLVEDARQQGATHILWRDDDNIAPLNGLLRLLRHGKDIVCATTCRRQNHDGAPIIHPMDKDYFNIQRPFSDLVPTRMIGLPFMLTSMAVFDKMDELFIEESGGKLQKGKGEIPYFAEPPRWRVPEIDTDDTPLVAEDEYFCWYARKAGFDIWTDMELSMEIGHIGSTVFYIQNDQKPANANVDLALGGNQ